MPAFSRRSLSRLRTCDPRLQALFKRVVQTYDCTIVCGHRGEIAQNYAYNVRPQRSRKPWPEGEHNEYPSKAVDVGPWPLDWNDSAKFYHLAGYVKAIAELMGLKIRWGGDWDSDGDLHDQTLYDLGHYEILE